MSVPTARPAIERLPKQLVIWCTACASAAQENGSKFTEAARLGYQIHRGEQEDGDLAGQYWWSLFREGWAGPEVSADVWPTQAEAEAGAVRALDVERANCGVFDQGALPQPSNAAAEL